MANAIKIDYSLLADDVLEMTQKGNVVLQHLNMDYADQTFKDSPVGLKNRQVEIIVTSPQDPATLWLGTTNFVNYKEGSAILVLNKVFDKSYIFDLMEYTLNQGAVDRAVLTLGRAHTDRYEIEALIEAFSVATPIILPSGKLALPADYAVIEQFASDNNIASEESVVFVNSAMKSNMTSATTLFSYAANKDVKFSDGLGANTNFSNGNGFIGKEFGLNFFLCDKLSLVNRRKYGIGYPIPTAPPIAEENIQATKELIAGAIESIRFNIGNATETNIKAGTLIKLVSAIGENFTLVLKKDIIVPVGTGGANVVLLPNEVAGNISNMPLGTIFTVQVLGLEATLNFNGLIMSNKSIAIAVKAPQTIDDNQAISYDPITGMALRLWRASDINTKALKISSDSIFGIKALLPFQIGAIQG